HRDSHRGPSVRPAGCRARQCPRGGDVPHDPELPGHDAGRVGAESGRLPRPVGAAGTVSHQGPGPARDLALVVRRGLEGERARGASPLSVRARPEAVVVALNRKRSAVMSKKLDGQVAVVTGASKGIGAAIAEYLAAAGAAVVINYASSKAGADAVVNPIRQADGKAVAGPADVSKPQDVRPLFAETKKAFGKLDILLTKAAI